jgi:hypothetical protein
MTFCWSLLIQGPSSPLELKNESKMSVKPSTVNTLSSPTDLNLPLIIYFLKIWVLQDVMTSSFVDRYQCFGGTLDILSYPEDGSRMIN